MAQELIYTSAERGLRPGTRGFCTVAYTRGMKPQTIQLLEAMSAYKNLYAVHSDHAVSSPVCYSHYRTNLTGRNATILSRVGPTLADHTRRSNKLAHHVIIRTSEQPAGGPAWLALRPDFFVDKWDGAPRHIAQPKNIPAGDNDSTFAACWEKVTGDAGWAGRLAYAFLSQPAAPAYLVFEPGMPMLELIAEALALVPPGQRWDVTFSTYLTSVPAGAVCLWRCCVPAADMLRDARRNPKTLVIDLTAPLPAPEPNTLVTCAREGTRLPEQPARNGNADSTSGRSRFIPLPNRHKSRLSLRPRPPGDNARS